MVFSDLIVTCLDLSLAVCWHRGWCHSCLYVQPILVNPYKTCSTGYCIKGNAVQGIDWCHNIYTSISHAVSDIVVHNMTYISSFMYLFVYILDAFVKISREEGIRGLYKGLGPALLLTSHGAIQVCLPCFALLCYVMLCFVLFCLFCFVCFVLLCYFLIVLFV